MQCAGRPIGHSLSCSSRLPVEQEIACHKPERPAQAFVPQGIISGIRVVPFRPLCGPIGYELLRPFMATLLHC